MICTDKTVKATRRSKIDRKARILGPDQNALPKEQGVSASVAG